jgi:hypothetical protein
MLKHCAANRKRQLSVLPNVSPYIYTTLKFLALQGAPYIYDISRLRVKQRHPELHIIVFSSRIKKFWPIEPFEIARNNRKNNKRHHIHALLHGDSREHLNLDIHVQYIRRSNLDNTAALSIHTTDWKVITVSLIDVTGNMWCCNADRSRSISWLLHNRM